MRIGTLKILWGHVLLCALIMLCEGFDLVVYGNVIPFLLADATLGANAAQAGTVGSMAFLGMLLGGLTSGRIGQSFKPKSIVLLGTAVFSASVMATGLADSVAMMSVLRFITGLGLGVVLPTALAMARNGSADGAAPLVISVTMAGIPTGGTLASATVAATGAAFGWRMPFAIAGIVGFAVLAISAKCLHADSGASPGAADPTRDTGKHVWTGVFAGRLKWVLCLFALATFADLFSYYGVTTWLAQLMREFELPMQNSLQLTLALNMGAIAGSLASSLIAMRLGPRKVALICGAAAAACLAGIATHPQSDTVLALLVVFTGAFAISAQNLLNTLVSNAFPPHLRSTALGLTLGPGRLGAVAAPAAGGAILQAGLGPEPVLLCFAAASLAGCIVIAGKTVASAA